jgi:gas vesicle protein
MDNEIQVPGDRTNVLGIVFGALIGALAGAVTMLLLTPQSGKEARIQIQEKGIELRDRATDMVEDTLAKVRFERKKIAIDGRKKANKILQQGQGLVVEQLDHLSEAAQAGKKALQNS